MITSLKQMLGDKARLLLSGLVCLVLVAGLAACQPKQTSTSASAPVAENAAGQHQS